MPVALSPLQKQWWTQACMVWGAQSAKGAACPPAECESQDLHLWMVGSGSTHKQTVLSMPRLEKPHHFSELFLCSQWEATHPETKLTSRASPGCLRLGLSLGLGFLWGESCIPSAKFTCHLLQLCQLQSSCAFLRNLCLNIQWQQQGCCQCSYGKQVIHWMSDIWNVSYMPKQK